MSSQPKLGIIVLNYNNWPDTQELLLDLNKVKKPSFSLFLVDNASTNQPILEEKIKDLNLSYSYYFQKNSSNVGFAKGVNQGLRFFYQQKFQYYLLLNNDLRISPNFLSCLLTEYKKIPPSSLLSPLIKHTINEKTLYGGEGYISPFLALARHHNYPSRPSFNHPKKVDFVSGCALLFDYSILKDNLWFDENFFLYLEDVDFCLRARKKNHFSYLTPNCSVYHKQSRSFKKPTIKLKYSFPSNLRFAFKHYPFTLPIWLFFLPLFYFKLYLLWSLKDYKKKLPFPFLFKK